MAVLCETVDVVAGHGFVILFLESMESIAVISAQTVAGGCPDKAVAVKINLIDETAWQLIVSIKQFAHLCVGLAYEHSKDYD